MVHLPIRFTPQAVPLLLLSVVDFQLVELLVEQGKRKDEQLQLDCKHINDQNCTFCRIDANSTDTIRLLRYLLRLNSTKIKPSTWQLENLPLKENSPFMCSFISPLYAELIVDCCDLFDSALMKKHQQSLQKQFPSDPKKKIESISPRCAACLVADVHLKFCSLCKLTGYCSTECQRKDWRNHKPECLLLQKNQTPSC